MTTKIIYDYSNVDNRDFAMPVEVTTEDDYELCPSCECEITSADYEDMRCTNCGTPITTQRSDEDERGSNH